MSRDDDQRHPKEDRLRRPADFRRVLRGGRRRRGQRFDVVVAAGGSERGARLGLAMPKSIGGAVVRNRAKRVVREYFRLHRGTLPPNVDIVVIARPVPGTRGRADADEIGRLLEGGESWRGHRSRRERPRS